MSTKKTLVLIHGWGTSSYNSHFQTIPSMDIAWKSKKGLIYLLNGVYQLHFYNLPGFCGVPEPKKDFYNVENFSEDLNNWLKSNKIVPDAILGYSFGGAVALNYKINYNSKTKIILVSPALKRRETSKSLLAKFLKVLTPQVVTKPLKHLYQLIFSKYYSQGTPFLQASYDKIARRDLRPLLSKVDPKEIILIFGDSDTSTPVNFVVNIANKFHLNLKLINGGDHEIGNTHPQKIFKAINNFL